MTESEERLRERIKRQQREIWLLRHVVLLMWKSTGYTQTWRINGEGKRRHMNDGRRTSYGALEDNNGKVLATSAEICKVLDRALRD